MIGRAASALRRRVSGRVRQWTRTRALRRYAFHYERVLGTSLELQVVATDEITARRAEAAVLAEVDRLEQILSGYLAGSELSHWQAQHELLVAVSPDLADVLAAAEWWRTFTSGAFNPAVVSLVDLLCEPSSPEAPRAWTDDASRRGAIRDRLHAMRQPLWTVNRACAQACRLTQLRVSLDGIAKGYVVDKAAARAASIDGVTQVLVNIGGDLRHVGTRPLTVSVAHPHAPAENGPPLSMVRLTGEALATSGGYHRPLTMGGRNVSHILDPRTGQPASKVISASAIAPDCASADALSTAFSVLTPPQSVALADSLPNVACLIVEQDGAITSNSAWRSRATGKRP